MFRFNALFQKVNSMKKTVMTLPIVLMIFMMVSCAGSNPPCAPAGSTVEFVGEIETIGICLSGNEETQIHVRVTDPDGNHLNGVEVEYHLGFAYRNSNIVDTDNDGIGDEPLFAFFDNGVYRLSPFKTTTNDNGIAKAVINIPGYLNLRRGTLSQETAGADPVNIRVLSCAAEPASENFSVNDDCGEDG